MLRGAAGARESAGAVPREKMKHGDTDDDPRRPERSTPREDGRQYEERPRRGEARWLGDGAASSTPRSRPRSMVRAVARLALRAASRHTSPSVYRRRPTAAA